MSSTFPMCPLYNHQTCKWYEHKEYCGIARRDQKCLRPKKEKAKDKKNYNKKVAVRSRTDGSAW